MIGVLHPKPPHQSQWDYWGTAPQTSSLVYQWDYWGTAPQTSSPVSMGLLGYCTPNLLTSLPMGLLGCCTPILLTSLNGIIGVLHPKPPHQSQWEYWGAAPQTSSPVSIRLLGYCTTNLLTSLPMGLLGCCTPNLLTSLNGIIGVLHPKPNHQSQSDYWGAAPQTSSPVAIRLLGCCTPNLLT